ncbi:uncharacterized protein B0H18DRAFT_954538 [Fomitopsis serialis]|uniref:uncharacterized protein n=1 Tax=Fomitopsis serialis TaxID=139415 RepID=UPI002007F692|nr:uncharacterized protein B0H18DRAFT_954538 [Neoantrodia serialis]KAH9926943.1 hypothetical protein B0H18DRAFT_954538 [Neoantrodia serialis]
MTLGGCKGGPATASVREIYSIVEMQQFQRPTILKEMTVCTIGRIRVLSASGREYQAERLDTPNPGAAHSLYRAARGRNRRLHPSAWVPNNLKQRSRVRYNATWHPTTSIGTELMLPHFLPTSVTPPSQHPDHSIYDMIAPARALLCAFTRLFATRINSSAYPIWLLHSFAEPSVAVLPEARCGTYEDPVRSTICTSERAYSAGSARARGRPNSAPATVYAFCMPVGTDLEGTDQSVVESQIHRPILLLPDILMTLGDPFSRRCTPGRGGGGYSLAAIQQGRAWPR